MRSVFVVAWQTFILLMRDKVFIPVLSALAIVGLIAAMAGDLSTWDLRKVILDIGLFGFHITGGAVAIFWGAKSMADSSHEGSMETQLAGPIQRSYWLIGKYIGLVATLILLASIFLLIWQAMLLALGHSLLTIPELAAFALVTMIWLCLSAISIAFATFCNLAVVVFCSIVLWFIGIMFPIFVESFHHSSWQSTLGTVSILWNLNLFLPGIDALEESTRLFDDIFYRITYGMFLGLAVVIGSCYVFCSRDVRH